MHISATTWVNQQNDCAPSEDSDQPGHPSLLCAQWAAKEPKFRHADSEEADQTGRMPRLIWAIAERTLILLVLSCRGSSDVSAETSAAGERCDDWNVSWSNDQLFKRPILFNYCHAKFLSQVDLLWLPTYENVCTVDNPCSLFYRG